jgi:hypothetical protein
VRWADCLCCWYACGDSSGRSIDGKIIGFLDSRKAGKKGKSITPGREEDLERQWKAGTISKKEITRRMAATNKGMNEVYSPTFGMTGAERVGYEIGRINQIQAQFQFTKENEVAEQINRALKPALAAQ